MRPTMCGRLATTMTNNAIAMSPSRMPRAPNGDDGDNEPMWSLELASAWATLDAECGSRALTRVRTTHDHSLSDASPAYIGSRGRSFVTSCLSTTTPSSPSRSLASSVNPHPHPYSLLFAPPLLEVLTIYRFKLCGVHSRRRVLTCRKMRGPLHLMTTWLDAAEMLWSTPLTLA
jgi:hypothetical protein